MEISVIPMGTDKASVSGFVAKALEVLRKERDIKYELTSMGTIVEGDLNKIFYLAKKMHEAVFDKNALRVVTIIKIDDRRDKPISMEEKIKSVREKLGKP
ncbi:MAG: MTH1187 family thiamine-binding protein [Candidatus Hadarchaeaceae archaeon]